MREAPGDGVVGATLNGSGSFVMRAERVGSETLLARIVQMVAEAQRSRAPIQRVASRDVPMPFSPPMEEFVIPSVGDVVAAVRRLC